MNRRSFFNILGSAVIGTAIALKIPETLIAKVPSIANGIPFHTLLRAYHLGAGNRNTAIGGLRAFSNESISHNIKRAPDLSDEPRLIHLSERRYKNTLDKLYQYGNLIGKEVGIGNDTKSFRFCGALVFPNKYISDDEICLVGDSSKRLIRIDDVYRHRAARLEAARKNFVKYF